MPEAAHDAAPLPDEATQERVARNDAVFRDANEGIAEFASGTDVWEFGVPFICECAETSCRELVRVSLREYEHVRSNPRWFLNVPGHEVNARGAAVVVERRDSYLIVEKIGRAGEVAESLDPRSE